MNISDERAEENAARSRLQGEDLVRNHLEHHIAQNPGESSDYVSWMATLHPENAEVVIDQRFFVPGNPWWTIYEETKNANIPTATAVAIADGDEHQQRVEEGHQTPANKYSSSPPEPSFCLICSPVDTFAGILVTFHAILGVFICEILALLLCYWPASMFYHLAQCFNPPCTGIWYSVLMMFYHLFAFTDSIVLLTSVLVTEIVAVLGWLTSLCTGGVLRAKFWHQYIRRVCHGLRIVFRRGCNGDPPRHFVLFGVEKEETPESVVAADQPNVKKEGQIHEQAPIPVEHIAIPEPERECKW